MSQERFAAFTRAMAKTKSRRQTVQTLTAGIAGGVLAVLAPKRGGAVPTTKRRTCCGYYCAVGDANNLVTRCFRGAPSCPVLEGCVLCGISEGYNNCGDACKAVADFCI
jgi:hypothetical protein